MMEQEPKRLAPTKEVLRELFGKSGNICAFPGCSQIMINKAGSFVGQICHIEGVKGERFNPAMTNEQRAAAANLMLMCYPHHTETNDVIAFPVARLARMKADHEGLFSDPGIRLYKAYVDHSERSGLRRAATALRLRRHLMWNLTPAEAKEMVDDINCFGERLSHLDIQSRLFICAVIKRALAVRLTWNVRSGDCLWLRWDDFKACYRTTDEEIRRRLEALEAHRLGGEDEMALGDWSTPAIRLNAMPNGDWDFWSALGEFCEASAMALNPILVDLDFTRLD